MADAPSRETPPIAASQTSHADRHVPSLPAGMVHAQRRDNLSIMSNGCEKKFIQAKNFTKARFCEAQPMSGAILRASMSRLAATCCRRAPPPPRPAIRYLPRAKGPTDVEVRRSGFFTPEHIRPLGSLGRLLITSCRSSRTGD